MAGTPFAMRSNHPIPKIAALIVCLAASPTNAIAQDAAPPAAVSAAAPAASESKNNADLYCRNIANAAADARYARQVDALAAMKKELDERIAALEKKRAEYEEWVKRREDIIKRADDGVVAIYAQMRPDAAAKQIAIMDEGAAAAILSRLNPRTASAILNEMEAPTAARLTDVMAGQPIAVSKAGVL